ncbi:helix-turn-helix domain-containing protein [Haladaptatus sp. NG-SE-30]
MSTIDSYPYRDRQVLEHLYVRREMSMAEIADRFGCGVSTIRRWLDNHDIDRRPPGRAEPSDS